MTDVFRQNFREEAREILADLESSLLALNENSGDPELVARIFRALHTLKGSGAMFGFEELAGFVHELETSFDEVRNGGLSVTPELVDLTLAALDQIPAMLAEDSAGSADRSVQCAAILARVRALTRPAQTEAVPQSVGANRRDSAAPEPSAPQPAANGCTGDGNAVWHIRFVPEPDLLRNGSDPLLLLRELGSMGELQARASLDSVPPLAELDPECCYIAWEMTLATDAAENALRDVFIFVEDQCTLEILPDRVTAPEEMTPAETKAPSLPLAAAPRAQDDPLCVADQTALGLVEPRRSAGRRSCDHLDNTTSLRVPAAKLDQLVNLVGELMSVQSRLSELAARLDDTEMQGVAEEVERLTSAMRESSMNLRMLPIRGTFEKFRRLVHDIARNLGKDVELTIEGAETELDKTVIDELGDPLMHLIRNSMDHGIETPEARIAAGKKAIASIRLFARHSGASVIIGVADDGAGIDAEAVRTRAIERELATAETPLSEEEIFSLIFQPGFSTARQVTDLSGRGVGMDVVRRKVESLRGSIDVASRRGEGTTVALRLPLTLAMIDGLLVTVGDAFYVLPVAATLECVELTREESRLCGGKHVAQVRGEMVPYIRLREYFRLTTPPPEREQIMIVADEAGRCGLVIDRVVGNCQAVIRNLGGLCHNVQAVAGATILGNGTVALILDPHRLVQEAVRAQSIRGRPPSRGRPFAAAQTIAAAGTGTPCGPGTVQQPFTA
ncbi:MAG TPA: chemotaxis protein CheA [Acidobacteriaceae bacterium]